LLNQFNSILYSVVNHDFGVPLGRHTQIGPTLIANDKPTI